MSTRSARGSVLVTDFDGTITQADFYQIAFESLVESSASSFWDDYVAGRLTHHEALRRIFATIRGDEASIMAAARRMHVDPDLRSALIRLDAAGWDVVIASAGCDWYIRRLLADQGIVVRDAATETAGAPAARGEAHVWLHTNPGELLACGGLHMELPTSSLFFCETTGIDKAAVVREALRTSRRVAFAGDGRPDLAPALLVPPELRFAHGWLGEQLHAQGVPFRSFERWSEIADRLLEVSETC